jgi:small-conductance mechanosensitive channel
VRPLCLLSALAIVALLIGAPASPARAGEAALQNLVGQTVAEARANLRAVHDDFAMAPAEAARLGAALAATLDDGTAIRSVTFALIIVIVGAGLEWLYWSFAGAPLRGIIAAKVATPRLAVILALRRLALLGFGLLLFALSILSTALVLPWPANVDTIVIASTIWVVTIRGASIGAEVVVSPHHPSLRLAPIDTRRSGFVVAGVTWLTMLAASEFLLPQLLLTLGSVPHLAGAVRIGIGGLVGVSLLAAIAIVSRPEERIRGRGRRRPRLPRAFVASVVIVATAVLALVDGMRTAAMLTVVAVVAGLLAASRRIVFFFWRDNTAIDAEPAEALPDMRPLIVLSVFRFATVLVGMAGLMPIIGVPLSQPAAGGNPLTRFAMHVADTVALAFVAHLAWIAVRFAIDRRLKQLAPLDPHGPPTANTRLLTLLPLLRTTLAIIFLLLFALSALWTLGIQIAPLLAGAGIFGLAIGFGAQTLVRDVISGVFFLIEDVFRIGEYIESGTSTKGTVEHISFRTVALRHHNGPLTFVPYGLLGTVRNDSRDWVIDKFNLPLPLSVDSERIRKMIKGIGEEMLLDPEFAPLIREPLKGKLYRVDPGVKIFRCKFMTAPGCQFDLRTAALRRIEAALVDAGIAFAGAGPQTILVRRAPDP